MQLRETVNSKQTLVVTIVGLLIVIAAIITIRQLGTRNVVPISNELFFTTDDGKTWFKAPDDSIPPFDHNGKPAVQAFVWTCDGGKSGFVSHLQRYTPEGRKRMLAEKQRGPQGALAPGGMGLGVSDTEVKRPGEPETAWIRCSDLRAGAILQPPRCPDNKTSPEPMP
jgi:hypothetical protein